MLPIVQRELVDNKCWLEPEQFVDVLAVAQCGPGATAVNTAIFTGYKLFGIAGVGAATLGVVLPSFFIILAIAATLTAAGASPLLSKVFMGIRPAVVALIISAAIGVGKTVLKDTRSYIIVGGTLIFGLLSKIHPALLILGAAIWGLVGYSWRQVQRVRQ